MNIYRVTIVEEGSTVPYSHNIGIAPSYWQAASLALAVEQGDDDDLDDSLVLRVLDVKFVAEVGFQPAS